MKKKKNHLGGEDYEFLTRTIISKRRHVLIPDALLWVRSQPGSMGKSMDMFMVRFRALAPFVDQDREVGMIAMLANGLLKTANTESRVAADWNQQFSPAQGERGWHYRFCETRADWSETQRRRSLLGCAGKSNDFGRAQSGNAVWNAEQNMWTDRRTETAWPLFNRWTISPQSELVPVLTWISPTRSADALISLNFRHPHESCGDGVTVQLMVDGTVLFQQHIFRQTAKAERAVDLAVQTRVQLLVWARRLDDDSDKAKEENDWCDNIAVSMKVFKSTA